MLKYFGLNIGNGFQLIIPELGMATEVYKLIESDRKHLRNFLDFVDDYTDVSSQISYLKLKMQGVANGTDKLFFIAQEDKIIGCINLHNIDIKISKAEIGYWIHSSYTGKNIVTKAVKTLCDYSFNILGLNKLVIFADVNNSASNAVALKSNFKFVGVKVQDAFLHDEFKDLNEYYLLKSDFMQQTRTGL